MNYNIIVKKTQLNLSEKGETGVAKKVKHLSQHSDTQIGQAITFVF